MRNGSLQKVRITRRWGKLQRLPRIAVAMAAHYITVVVVQLIMTKKFPPVRQCPQRPLRPRVDLPWLYRAMVIVRAHAQLASLNSHILKLHTIKRPQLRGRRLPSQAWIVLLVVILHEDCLRNSTMSYLIITANIINLPEPPREVLRWPHIEAGHPRGKILSFISSNLKLVLNRGHRRKNDNRKIIWPHGGQLWVLGLHHFVVYVRLRVTAVILIHQEDSNLRIAAGTKRTISILWSGRKLVLWWFHMLELLCICVLFLTIWLRFSGSQTQLLFRNWTQKKSGDTLIS